MSTTLFPLLSAPAAESGQTSGVLPLYREIAWDFQADRPVWQGGSPVWVTGAQAVAVWAWNALHTVRGALDIVSRSYGCELQALTGRAFSPDVKTSEAVRYVRECLAVNPYITDVRQISVDFSGARLTIRCAVDTIYGEVDLNAIGL